MVFINGGIMRIIRYLKSFYRRGRYGWDYSDTSSMDEYLSKIIPQMLRYLATRGSCPPEFYDEKNKSGKKWEKQLIEMAEGFENYLAYDLENTFDYRSNKYKKLKANRDKSLKSFVKYFDCLWW